MKRYFFFNFVLCIYLVSHTIKLYYNYHKISLKIYIICIYLFIWQCALCIHTLYFSFRLIIIIIIVNKYLLAQVEQSEKIIFILHQSYIIMRNKKKTIKREREKLERTQQINDENRKQQQLQQQQNKNNYKNQIYTHIKLIIKQCY